MGVSHITLMYLAITLPLHMGMEPVKHWDPDILKRN